MSMHTAPSRFRRVDPLLALANVPIAWVVEHAADRVARGVMVLAAPVFVLLALVSR